jgi:hypothetical protein
VRYQTRRNFTKAALGCQQKHDKMQQKFLTRATSA